METTGLVLRDETLRVLYVSVLEWGEVPLQLALARDPRNAGHVSVAQVRELVAVLDGPSFLVTDEALSAAREDLACAVKPLDLDEDQPKDVSVSLYVWDDERDGDHDIR